MKKNLILSVLMFMSFPLAAMSWGDNDGIFDFVPSRDLYAVKSMIENSYVYEDSLDYFFEGLRSLDSMINKILTHSYAYDLFFYSMKSNRGGGKVLRKDGKTIGFMFYQFDDMTLYFPGVFTWKLEMLVVDEEYRSKGYGSSMLQYVIEEVRACGGDQIVKFYDLLNPAVEEFYKKNGFHTGNKVAIKMIDSGDLSGFNEAKAVKAWKSFVRDWYYGNNFDKKSMNLYDFMSLVLKESINNIDNVTIEKLYDLCLWDTCSCVMSCDFDDYKIKIKMKLEKIKAALELEGPERETWSDYTYFKIMQSVYHYL